MRAAPGASPGRGASMPCGPSSAGRAEALRKMAAGSTYAISTLAVAPNSPKMNCTAAGFRIQDSVLTVLTIKYV